MAHLAKKGEALVWFPEYYKIRGPVLLDPNLTPMQNAWRVVDICASVWLNAFHVWSEQREDLEDLEQTARLVVMNELRRRVKKGLYDRNYSFYMNVRSCAMSKMQHVIIEPWLKHIRERDNLLDGNSPANKTICDGEFTLYDVMSTKPMHRWITDAERRYKTRDWQDYEREGDRVRVLQKQIDGEYDDYCSDCIEFGVDPITKEQFIGNDNYTDDELKLLYTPPDKRNAYQRDYWKRRALLDPTWSEKRRQYNKTYYEKTKKKKV